MHAKKGVLKGWHKGTHAHHIPPLRETRRFTTWGRNGGQSWVGGGIGLDASNMGGGELVVGIEQEQVSSGFDGMNYGDTYGRDTTTRF